MATGNNSAAERISSALGQNENMSEVIAAAGGEHTDDLRAAALAMLDHEARSADFTRVATIMARRGGLDQPGTGGSQLLEQLDRDEAVMESLSEASKRAGRLALKLGDTDVLQVISTGPGGVHLSLGDTDVLQARLGDTDVLQLRWRKTLLRVLLNDTEVQWRLGSTDVLQLRLGDTDVLQLRLNDKVFRLGDTDVLQLRWNETGRSRRVNGIDTSEVGLSETDVLELSRREKYVTAALEVFDKADFPSNRPGVSRPHRTVAELLSSFARQDRDEDLLALLEALVEFLPALELVSQSNVVLAFERLAKRRPKTLLALARLAGGRPDMLRALVDLYFSDPESPVGQDAEGLPRPLVSATQHGTEFIDSAESAP